MTTSNKPSFEKVQEFHMAFGHPSSNVPVPLSEKRKNRRIEWLEEEIEELRNARTLVDQVDAVVDLLYFAYGTMVELGVDPDVPFNLVHQANMSKLAANGKPIISDGGKILKPSGWVGPEKKMTEYLENRALLCLLNKTSSFELKSEGDDCLVKCLEILWLHRNTSTMIEELQELSDLLLSNHGSKGDNDLDIGVSIDENVWNESKLFRNAGVVMNYARCNHMNEWDFEELLDNTANSIDLAIVTLSAGVLFEHSRVDLGHAVLLSHIDGGEYVIFDTAHDHFGFFRISKEKLISAIKARLGGLLTLV